MLQKLDSLITTRHDFEEPRKIAITQAWQDYNSTENDEDKYNILRTLYENYHSYRIDSALIVADKRLEIARKLNQQSKTSSATINLAEAYAKSGEYSKAIEILDTLDENSLKDYHKKYLNSVYRKAYTLKEASSLMVADKLEAISRSRALRDEAFKEADPASRGYYTLKAEKLKDEGMYDEAVAVIEEADAKFDLSDNAAMQFTMGEIYLAAGEKDKALEHLTRSSILDITAGTKEYKSLILLAAILFEEGDLDRAFHYINCAFEDAKFSRANLRTNEIMQSMPVIDKAYHDASAEGAKRMHKLLIVTAIMAVLLLISLIFAIMSFRQKHKAYGQIANMNKKLEEQNSLLHEADDLKLNNINILMLAYARHISRLGDFRKKIYRLIRTGQYDKALEAVGKDKGEAPDVAAFNEMFDDAFLSMFPDFIDEVNRYMKQPFEIKNPGRLTPELRLVAMMRLGMTDTDRIAGMFHYSPQTVYNLRSVIRSRLKVSWGEFEAYLTSR